MGTIVLFRLQLPNFLLDVVISAGHLLGRCFRIVQNLLCCMHGRVQRLDGISRLVAQVHPFHLCDQVVQRIPIRDFAQILDCLGERQSRLVDRFLRHIARALF